MTSHAAEPQRTAWRRAARSAAGTLLWAAAALGLLSIVGAMAAFAFGVQPLVFRSGSMAPEIRAGALAVAEEIPATQVDVGDVVSVINDRGVRVTHRVVAVSSPPSDPDVVQLSLQGDANPTPDATSYKVTNVDRVVFDIPWLGYPISWFSGPWGLFLAGAATAAIVVIATRRPAGRRRGLVGASVLALGALAVPLIGVDGIAGTDAAFTDVADFEAGVIAAHRVRIFDLDGGADSCENLGTATGGFYDSIRVKWIVKDIRYETSWTSTGLTVSPKVDSQVAATGAAVSTTFRSARLSGPDIVGSAGGGPVVIEGWSRLRSNPDWVTSTKRSVTVNRQSATNGGVVCAGVDVAPNLVISQPTAGGGSTAVQTAINAGCGATPVAAACGTAEAFGGKTITAVSYELKRDAFLQGTQCWNGTSFGYNNCGVLRPAAITGTTSVNWRVPGNVYGQSVFTGAYQLTIRATDSSGQTFSRVVTYNVS